MSCSKRDPIKDHEKFHRDHTLDPKSILMRQVEEHNMTITSRPVKSNARRASAPSNFGQAAESFPWLLPF
ncbi:hypothetical protein HBH64_224330 [Parastagonospora nodorum]|nr:hypothetical protein HBI10_031990 [Parastagonospora nodorum]KAH4033167.1 hypothetical protein HBI13_007110 [Parastagonospora nodorum]KAH4073505.1 hypothetical protein HBH50_054960 [Parastagonospora nodorum]KAH4099431.1 hypothetical protein HBH48_007160 [Parastagonospora nodorum]KAH4200279.1 hypothetical protein HBH42_041980 [Parastagonospora nodorum]